MLQAFVGPFKVIGERDGLPHAAVLHHVPAKVEDDSRRAGRGAIGQFRLDDLAVVHAGKIVAARPFLAVSLAAECIFAGLEGFEGSGVITKVFDPYPVKVVAPDVERQILAPVVGIALVDHAAVHIDGFDHVGTRAWRDFKPSFVQPRAGFLVPFLGPGRHRSHLINQ